MLSKKDRFLAAAQKYLERGQNERALEEFARVVLEDPGDTRTWLRMAEIHARTGALAQARDIYLRTAEIYVEQGLLNKAVTVYKSVLKLTPGLPQVRERLAEIYRRLGMVADALRELELAVEEYQAAGHPAEALPALRRLLGLHPDNVVSRIRLAEAASHVGALEEAITQLRSAADQLKMQGRNDEYVRVAERLLFHQPNDFSVARELAAVYVARRNPRLALTRLQSALKAAPRDPHNVTLLAEALAQLDPAKAISVWRELADLHDAAGRTLERDAAIRSALALDPTDGETRETAARWGLGSGVVPRGRGTPPPPPSGSSVSAQAAPSSASMSVSGVRLPAQTFAGMERVSGASSLSGLGVSGLTPPPSDDVSRILAESDVFVKYGLPDWAVDHLRRVFTVDPKHRGARERLASVLGQLERRTEAAAELATLAEQLSPEDAEEAARVAERALSLDPACALAAALLGRAPGLASTSGGAGADDIAAELEQVDFFAQQSLHDEALAVLSELEERYPGHELVVQRRQALGGNGQPAGPAGTAEDAPGTAAEDPMPDVGVDDDIPGAIPTLGGSSWGGAGTGAPIARLSSSEQVDPGTHGDLGIAYKQMGLYDAAIAEFQQLALDKTRRVFAYTMIGECVEAKGELAEAVGRYKEALNLPQVTPSESLELYYLLGAVFERLGDIREALYFFENVGKREAGFRDVEDRIAALRPRNIRRA